MFHYTAEDKNASLRPTFAVLLRDTMTIALIFAGVVYEP
jgi:hypothetical protein